jgi:hypothetical protein
MEKEAVPPLSPSDAAPASSGASPGFSLSSATFPLGPASHLPVIRDERVIQQLLLILLNRAGMAPRDAANVLGIRENAIRQYLQGRRSPGLFWFIRFAELCGARVVLEWPEGR